MGDRTRIPKLVEGVDIRKLPIGPEEAFLLSRVDGASGPAELAIGTGLADGRVEELLAKLQSLGAIAYPTSVTMAQAPVSRAPARPAPNDARGASPKPRDSDPYSTSDLDRILGSLERADHYQVLGVSRDASKPEIKAAYFGIVGRYHPDRYFGSNLGEAKARLQRIVARLTEAYDTLTRSESRIQYDATLSPSAARPADLRASHAAWGAAPRVSVRVEPAPPSPEVPPLPPTHASSVAPSPSVDPAARQRALARMLSGSMAAMRRSSMSIDAVAGLHSLSMPAASTVSQPGGPAGVRPHTAETPSGQNALGVVNALKLALAKTPDDPDLQRRLKEAELVADTEMNDRLQKQAKEAKDAGRAREAMLLYERAARAARNADLYLEAARCSITANESPRRSAGFAKSGLELAPNHAALHSLLGRIYAEAGMTNSALAALEKARSLDPSDETVKALLDRVKNA